MSLIDEALKRAQAAQQNEPAPQTGSRPWTPPPMPDRSAANRRRFFQIGLFAALAILLVSGLLYWRQTGRGLPAEASAKAGSTAVPAAIPTPLEEVQVAPPSRGVPLQRPIAVAAPAPSAKKAGGEPSAPASTPAAPAPAPAADASPGRPAPAPATHHTYAGTAVLPDGTRLELGGIVYSESNATAVLNGRIVGAGSYVEGFEVVRIDPTRVELTGKGLTIFLTLK